MHFVSVIQIVLLASAHIWVIGGTGGNNEPVGIDAQPFGPFYCQARCISSCIETNLATSLEECGKFCPPFGNAMACQDADCWRNCGIPSTSGDKPPPPAVNFVMAQYASIADDRLQDPFTIELTWDPAPSASLYIVELYPLNRKPRPGENNFFRALTTFPTYVVRKEDECTIYDIRVMPVNAFGVGAPQYTRIEAPRPIMSSADFYVNSIQRDSRSNSVVATISYAIPSTWPINDVDLNGIRVRATDCRAANKSNETGKSRRVDDVWYLYYDAKVEKTATPTVRMTFLEEVVKADCLFQMRVSSLTTRCNTTTYFDSNGGASQDSNVGIDFRINCLTAEGFSCNEGSQSASPLADHQIMPAAVDTAPQAPQAPTVVVVNGNQTVPIAPEANQLPQAADGPVADISTAKMHPFLVDYIAINSQFQVPMSCDISTLDVQASTSSVHPSLVDLRVSWSEQNPVPQRTPAYFLIRYGPVTRTLVVDMRQPRRIIPGYENIARTGRPADSQHSQAPLERELKIVAVPKDSLLLVQVCAIYDANIDQMILWDVIQGQYVDMVALQPSQQQVPDGSVTSQATLVTDESSLNVDAVANDQYRPASSADDQFAVDPSSSDENSPQSARDNMPPVIIQVGMVDSGHSTLKLWPMIAVGGFAALVMAVIIFMAVVRLWSAPESKFVKSYPVVPVATITQQHVRKEKEEEMKEPEKVALP